VLDLKEEAQFTYNILREMTLTEDRTLKYAGEAEAVIAKYMQQSKDSAYLQKVVAAPRAATFEHSLNHHGTSLWYPGSVI
ncbi:hypothetical protein VJI72_08855, partial [Parvimonas micra]|uniref:hypothetical protein n=1 Tax=Parvimonas micra TaxID=33033 RepID=UPI002B4A3E08